MQTTATLVELGVDLAAMRVEVDGQPVTDVVSFDQAAGWAKALVSADEEAALYRYRKVRGVVAVFLDHAAGGEWTHDANRWPQPEDGESLPFGE